MGPTRGQNAQDRRWRAAIMEFGCVACWIDGNAGVPAAQHHIVEWGQRLGHLYSLPLCDPGHHQPDSRSGKIALHPGRNPLFTSVYGTERQLLDMLQRMLGFDLTP